MSGLTVYSGNRLETLVDLLAETVAEAPGATLAPETIVVQSRGMARWLSMALAQRCGVWANCRYPFPNTFLQELFRQLDPRLPEDSPFSLEALAFRIMGLLPACLESAIYRRLKRYLQDDRDGLKAYQLAGKIADTFDQYLVFRPDMIFRWEAGREGEDPEEKWQADLWRRLVAACGDLHRARLARRLVDRIGAGSGEPAALPHRLSIFGISYLPPIYLEVFAALAHRVPVHFFLINPCREYWGDIVSAAEGRAIRRRSEDVGHRSADVGGLYLETGNPLLAAMGGAGREFFDLLTGFECRTVESFQAPRPTHLLAAVQRDVLELRDPTAPGNDPADGELPEFASPAGPTIQFHACHSPLREIEVLYDRLLAMFDEDPTLNPRDVVVMAPDIDRYAPFIQAVFDAQPEGRSRIPYSVADRSVRRESGFGEAFLSLLEFKDSRFGAGQVISFLEIPAVRSRFTLSDTEMEAVVHWVRETNIRWGIDADSRTEFGLPAYPENSWKSGIDRMLLGYVMPGGDREMFGGILPYDPIEGSDGETLGKFISFLDALFETARELRRERTLSQWRACLLESVECFFESDDAGEPVLQVIRAALDELGDYQERAAFRRPVTLEPVKAFMARRLESDPFGHGFLTGGITFCALLPMRSIPFRVICLIGLNCEDFPRDTRPPGFDLISRRPRRGDRSRRADDRYLFLEAVVSARDRLYISYVGRGIEDNAPIPPAVPVSALLDVLHRGYGQAPERLVTGHRLQAFSPSYFDGQSALFSYSEENLEAARALLAGPRPEPTLFCSGRLDPPPDEWRGIDLQRLGKFFRNPSRFLLRERLGIRLEGDTVISEDRENFATTGLERYRIVDELVEAGLAGRQMTDLAPVFKAQGRLPPGTAGEAAFGRLRAEAASVVARAVKLVERWAPAGRSVELNLDGYLLTGKLETVFPAGHVCVDAGSGSAIRQLDTWIRHLALCSAAGEDGDAAPGTTYLVCRDRLWRFGWVENSRRLLQVLLDLYWEGLGGPLNFFPATSLAYAETLLLKGKSPPQALKEARKRWAPNRYGKVKGDSEDPYHDLCFGLSLGASSPLEDEAFARLAEVVFAPMLKSRQEI